MADLPPGDYVPARMLNEFAYCPRLAYLEWLTGDFAHNTDTLEGRWGHRNVDREDRKDLPTANEATLEAEEKIHARSVLLSAHQEGLIARMDLLELEGPIATPVDYKKGEVPDRPEGPWEPEKVQLCAQALILREAGYTCTSGILYFIASKTRVEVPFTDELIARTRQLLAEMKEMASTNRMPLPLVDSPKCPRCSLVGICLPDETRLLLNQEQVESETDDRVRRLIPARDDALPVYVQAQGASVGKAGERIEIRQKNAPTQDARLMDISQLCLFGNVQLSAQALRELANEEIPIVHFSYGGWFTAITVGPTHKNALLRIAQHRAAADPALALPFARAFIEAKVRNQRTLIRRHCSEAAEIDLHRMSDLITAIQNVASAESLLGLEGTAARIYFHRFAEILQESSGFTFENRNRRPPRDPVNAILSFLYAMLMKDCLVTLTSVGFDPYVGLFHVPKYGRPALALDLAEEFRPIIADSVALSLINTGEIRPSDFIQRINAFALTDRGRKVVIAAYERRMDTLIQHPVFGYRVSYRRALEVQARLLGRVLSGELKTYPGFTVR
jgi:CRISP-associated protein Cas1